jgi:hypothetical protein
VMHWSCIGLRSRWGVGAGVRWGKLR